MQQKFIQVLFGITFMCHIHVFWKGNTTKVEDLVVSLNSCFLYESLYKLTDPRKKSNKSERVKSLKVSIEAEAMSNKGFQVSKCQAWLFSVWMKAQTFPLSSGSVHS